MALVVVPGATRVVVEGRAPVVLVDEASDARGVARAVEASAAGRVVRGRFAPVVVEGAIDCRDVVFPGDERVAAPGTTGVLRTVGFRFSSPDVTDESSGSASDAVGFGVSPVLLAADPGVGRVGGLFRLEPTVLAREVALDSGFDAVAVDARALLVDAAVGRRAPTVAVPLAAVGLRGGTASLPAEPAFEAILRRTDDVGVEGAGSFLRCGLPGGAALVLEGASASLAGVGASILIKSRASGAPAHVMISTVMDEEELACDVCGEGLFVLLVLQLQSRLLHALLMWGKLPSRQEQRLIAARHAPVTANDSASLHPHEEAADRP